MIPQQIKYCWVVSSKLCCEQTLSERRWGWVMEVKVNLEEIRDFSIQIGSDLIGRAVLSIHDLDPYQIETVTRDNEFWGSKAWFSCLEDMPDTDIFYLVVENEQGRMWALLPVSIYRT